jgi:hypothetical protein
MAIAHPVVQEDCPRYGEEVKDVETQLTVSSFDLFVLARGCPNLQLLYARSAAFFRVPCLLTALPLDDWDGVTLTFQHLTLDH